MEGRFEPYLSMVLEQVPRLIGQLDRNPLSRTYGCFDRQYWHYNQTAFPCARYQEAVLTLSYLYKLNHKGNPYFSNKRLKEWINSSLNFWSRIHDSDGSLSEWYPNEHSYVATAFGAYAISETLMTMGKDVENRENLISLLEHMGDWLSRTTEKRAQNQECGAAAALYNIYMLSGKKKYAEYAEAKVERLAKMQHKEGWFNEYGGPDVGYLSLAMFYLSDLYQKSKFSQIKIMLDKAVDFISYFVHPDMTFGGVYGSRNTEYMFPYCFEVLHNKKAGMIAWHIRQAVIKKSSVMPNSLDDRYLCYITYIYIQSYMKSRSLGRIATPPYRKNMIMSFDSAGIFVYSKNRNYFVCNCKKGGTFFAFVNGKAYEDSGIDVFSGKRMTSSNPHGSESFFDGKKLRIWGRLSEMSSKPMTPGKSMALNAFQLSLGRSGYISKPVKGIFRNKTITGTRLTDVNFMREISLGKKITITDEVSGHEKDGRFVTGTKSSYIYVPSSRYFQPHELGGETETRKISSLDKIRITRTIG